MKKPIEERFVENECWGLECLVNLVNCDIDRIQSHQYMREFITGLCEQIDMNPVGEPIIERFGSGHLYGISLMQLIETSSIVGHFAESSCDAYIDIFSCKEFKPEIAAKFCQDFFKARTVQFMTIIRDTRYIGKESVQC